MSDRLTSRPHAVNSTRSPWIGSARNGVCPECRAEMADPRSRRYRYPFIACPNCGPGYTVTQRLPFARVNTTFAPFEPCDECWAEFEDPGSRHFGSPTICCSDCGPSYWIEPSPPLDDAIDVVDSAVQALRAGSILGLKDTCCFRFMVRALDVEAVERLRRRIEMPEATFALMVAGIDEARTLVEVDPAAEQLLLDPSAPQVLLPRVSDDPWLDVVTGQGHEAAVMLPRAAIHFLLTEAVGEPLLVARAARRHDVIVLENEDARDELMDVADALVLHDLDLHAGCEDTLVRLEADQTVVLRRASGLAPKPIELPHAVPSALGIGSTHEVSVAVVCDRALRLSQPIGDLGTARASDAFDRTVDRMVSLWECTPEIVAVDPAREPVARALAVEFGARVVVVDHHAAHVGAVLAEHGIEDPALGVSLDSSGQIVDPELGAGRFLRVDGARVDVLEEVPGFRVPGADAAPRDPWRVAVGLIHDVLGPAVARTWAPRLIADPQTAGGALSMLEHDVGCVRVHSFGKLYDAAAAVLGIARRTPAADVASRRLQRLAGSPAAGEPIVDVDTGTFLADWLDELLRRGTVAGDRTEDTRWVQRSLAGWIAARAFELAAREDLGIVAAGGGCFSNPWLRRGFHERAHVDGRRLALGVRIPSGDAGLAVGQVWMATRA